MKKKHQIQLNSIQTITAKIFTFSTFMTEKPLHIKKQMLNMNLQNTAKISK